MLLFSKYFPFKNSNPYESTWHAWIRNFFQHEFNACLTIVGPSNVIIRQIQRLWVEEVPSDMQGNSKYRCGQQTGCLPPAWGVGHLLAVKPINVEECYTGPWTFDRFVRVSYTTENGYELWIEIHLKEKRWKDVDWIRLAEDRDQWWTLVNMITSL